MNRVQAGAFLLAAWLVTMPLAAAATGATAAAGAEASTAAVSPSFDMAVEADTVEFRITVYENASARWRFTYTRVLDNESERRQFEAFAERFEENDTAAFRDFRDIAHGLAASGRNATGRQMRAVNFSKGAKLGGACVTRDCGTIRMAFTWTSFAADRGERLVVGDVFGTGLYLAADQELVIAAGPDLAFDAVAPDTYNDPNTPLAQRRSITYQGEMRFTDRRPRAVFVPREQAPGTSTGNGGTTPGGDDGVMPMGMVAALLAVAVGIAAAFAWWRTGGAVARTPGGGDGGAGAEPVSGEPAVPEEELLTDEDRVVSLLEDNGGRMKQVDIVEETGWSKSKVSMLLSDMEDDDDISKLRVGRENIISLTGHEPEAASSPHDEE